MREGHVRESIELCDFAQYLKGDDALRRQFVWVQVESPMMQSKRSHS